MRSNISKSMTIACTRTTNRDKTSHGDGVYSVGLTRKSR